MTSIANNTVAKVAAVAMGVVMAFAFATPALALTQTEATAIITALGLSGPQAAVIQALVTSSTPSTSAACSFTVDLTIGSKGADVTCLQNYLISKGFAIPAGATGYFGAQTQAAVKAWQAANGITPSAGYFGPKSRAAFVAMGGSTTTTPTVPAGTGLSVSACPTQPTNSLAPQGATRVKLTCFKLTAGNDGDVTVNSVTVQKDGLFTNAALAGITLLNGDTGTQIGNAKTLNSNFQATIGEPMKVMRGQTVTLYVAGNMASSLASYAGESVGLSVVAVNTTATVTGVLPIVGSHQVTNATLTVGALTTQSSSAYAANAATTTKEVGATGQKASGIRITASSAEDVLLKSIRWNQIGSVTGSDIANVVTYVNGTAYPTVVSSDGKYYESALGSGIVIAKGNSVEAYVQYDIVGGSGRTIIFHIDKNTDIYGLGQTYGYGANATGGNSGTPYYFGQQVTVSGATVTTIAKDTAVVAANIAANVPNQVLGGFTTDIKGESMTVQSMVFTVATTAGGGYGLLTNVTLVDENGAVKAGPVDATYTNSTTQTITFTDSVTIPTGVKKWRILGKLPNTITNGGTFIVSTTPSSGWTNVKGDITGNSISLSANGNFAMNTMTVKSGALAITRGTNPASTQKIAGATGILFVNLQFDASNSGEDVRFSSIPLSLAFSGNSNSTDINSCLIVDGSTTISDTAINPSGATSSAYTATATLTNPVTVAKGTVKTLGVKCNILASATATGGYAWDHGSIGSFSVTGLSSGSSITSSTGLSVPSDTAVTVTVGSGAVSVTTDAASPSYTLVAAGSTDVVVGAYKFTATNEAVNLSQLALQLTNYASSSISDVIKASVYDGATKIGEAFFTTDNGSGSASVATTTFSSPLAITTSSDKTLTVKLDLASISSNGSATSSGHLVAVDYIAGIGTGVDSGTTYNLNASNGSTAVAGVRVMKSFPTVSKDTLSSTGLADGILARFKVTADSHGPISLTEFNLRFATTSVVLSNVNIYAFTDSSYSTGVTGVSANGQLSATGQQISNTPSGWASASTNFEFSFTTSAGASTTIQVPAGATRYFEVRGTVSGVVSGSSVQTTLRGDTAAAFIGGGRLSNPLVAADESAPALDTADEAAFIWSPNSTTTPVRASADWTNGFGISGLPSNGLIFTRSQ